MSSRHLLLLLGGTYHDFEGFAEAMAPVYSEHGYQVRATNDLSSLLDLETSQVDVVAMYSCMGGTDAQGEPVVAPDATQTAALTRWVEQGGGLVAAHAATVSAKNNPQLRALFGAAFASHPPQFAFTVYPLSAAHPVTQGIDAFSVFDEFYIQEYEADIAIHMAALERGVCYPMVWTRCQGEGRVVNVAPGHSERVWSVPAYQQLMVQAAGWAMENSSP